jgi:hypothetical protein
MQQIGLFTDRVVAETAKHDEVALSDGIDGMFVTRARGRAFHVRNCARLKIGRVDFDDSV